LVRSGLDDKRRCGALVDTDLGTRWRTSVKDFGDLDTTFEMLPGVLTSLI